MSRLSKRLVSGKVLAALVLVAGCGSSQPSQMGGLKVTVAAPGLDAPLDATPDPAGHSIFFVANGTAGQGVFQVAAGGGAVTSLFVGAPLVAPRAIVVSTDGKTLYVADPMAAAGGAIFVLDAAGGAPSVLPGSLGTSPRALDLVSESAADVLYAVANAPDASAAIQRFPVAGGGPTVVLKGAPLASPDGVTVSKTGAIYVTDGKAGSDASGAVIEIQGGVGTVIAQGIHLGAPAGLALPLEENVLFVSALDGAGASEVVVVDTMTHATTTFNDVISQSHDSGGLHRAHQVDVYAWADTKATPMGMSGTGTVFVIK